MRAELEALEMLTSHSRRKGVVLVLISAVLWSTAGLFVRMADVDTWTMVAWRSAFACVTLGVIVACQQRRELRGTLARFGIPELFSIVITVFAGITYVMALQLTTVANVMIVYAALPFIATGIAYFWLGERVTVRFLVASSVSIAAIIVMAGAVKTRHDLLGILASLATTVGFAIQLVHSKRHPLLNTTLLIAVSAGACVIVAAPLARPGLPSPLSLLACALYGVLTTGFAYILALEGGRLISSGEAGLISMLDVVLAPLWVWLLFAERPSRIVLISGCVVLCAVIWYLVGAGAAVRKVVTDREI